MSQFLVDYRTKHPEYDDLNDSDLSTALHGKYVNDTGADLSLDEFHSAIEFAPEELYSPQEPVIPTSDMDQGLPPDPTEPIITGPQPSMLDMVGAKLTGIGHGISSGAEGAIPQAKLQIAGMLQRNEVMDEEEFNSSPRFKYTPYESYEQYKSVTESLNPVATWLGKKGKEMAAAARAEIKPSTTEQGSPEYYAEAITGSVINMLPALGVSILGRRPDIGLGIMLAQAKGGSYESGRAEGLGTDEAEIYSTLNTIAEIIPSAIPIAKFMKPTGKFVRDMIEAGLTESAQETVTAALQAGIDKGYISPDMTWDEASTRMIDGAVVGLGAGTTISAATSKIANKMQAKEMESAVIAEMEAEFDRNMPSAEQEAVDSLSPDNAQVTIEMRPRIPIPERLPGRTEDPEEEADVASDTSGVPQQRADEGGVPADQPDIDPVPGQGVGDIAPEPARSGEAAEPVRGDPGKPIPAVDRFKKATTIDTSVDSLLIAAAKKGGLNRDGWEAEGIDPASFTDKGVNNRVFGRPLFRKTGGMTPDDLAEMMFEEGYVDHEVTGNEALVLISKELAGDKVYTPTGLEGRAEELLQEHRDTQEQMAEIDYDPTEWEVITRGMSLEQEAAFHAAVSSDIDPTGYTDQEYERMYTDSMEAHDDYARRMAEESEAGSEDFTLAQETEVDREERERQAAAALERERSKTTAAEEKVQADAEVDDFVLSGSDRTADVAASRGQEDIFAPAYPGATPEITERNILNAEQDGPPMRGTPRELAEAELDFIGETQDAQSFKTPDGKHVVIAPNRKTGEIDISVSFNNVLSSSNRDELIQKIMELKGSDIIDVRQDNIEGETVPRGTQESKPDQEKKPASSEEPKAEQATNYSINPIEAYDNFRKSIADQTATAESVKKDADNLVANKDNIIATLSKFTKAMLQKITRSPRTDFKKPQMVKMSYDAMLSAHILADSVITVFGGSQTYEEQIIEQVAKQTQEDVDNAYDKQREYRARRKADIEGDVKSLKNPETLAKFDRSKGKEIVEQMIDYADIQPGDEVLELSEFGGSIGAVIKESSPGASLELIDVLPSKEFMEYSGKKYDKIIMSPPIGAFQDIDHVKHAYDLLKPGGKIVSIMGVGVKSSNKKAVEFRRWIDGMGSYIENLPVGKSGVMVTLEKNDSNTMNYKLDEATKGKSEIFRAPGHNYVGLYRSMGIPARREFVNIDGKKVRVPAMPQRIEPIMRKLIKIAGRRIYFGKIKGKSTQGFYRGDVGEIRTRRKNDVEVLAHELAHYLDMYSNVSLPNFKKLYKNHSDEVKALSYTDADKKVMEIEGFAEFVRLWLTNSTEAQQRAPVFYEAFSKLLARDKKLSKLMVDMRELMHKFYFQGPDKLGQALIGKSSSFLGDFEQWKYRRDSRIRQQTIDRFHAARVIEQELTDKIGVVEESAWKQLRIANGGSEGISDYIMNYGTVEFNEAGDLVKNGKSLHDVLEPVKTIDRKPEHKGDSKIDILMRYFAGRRAVELHRQGRENLIPKETAREWAKLGKDYPVFDSIHKEFQAFNDRMMEFYVQSGMITPKARNAMRSMNKDYVPFNRIREALASGGGPSSGFQKLKGGTANLNDILVNIQDGITANVRAALTNKAKQRLYGYIAGHKDGAIFATKIAPDSRPVQVYVDEMMSKINKVLDASGIEFEGEIDLTDPDLMTFWQHGVKPQLNESGNIVDTVIINGKKKYYEVQDPLLQDMLLSMNPESYSSFMNVMFGVKNFFTRMITLGIEFTGANLVRDTVGATFLSKSNFLPFVDSFKGMYSFIAKDQHFQDFLRSGGGYSSRIHAQTKEGAARRRIAVDEFGVMSVPERLLSTIDNIASAFEYGTRIGEFRVEKKSNRSDMDAGFASREISTDFSVLGANRFLTGYIRTVPFLNAMVQSQDRVYREAFVKKKYDGNPTRLAMKAFMGITIPTLILYLINRDDDDYKEIPDYEKRTNWHIKVGDGQFIKMPRPYDVGFVFATMPELFFKYLADDKGKEFSDGMIWTLTQMYGIDGTPAMMTGWWDIVRNKKWTGAPVVPKGLSDVEATEQYSSNTSETFIRLGQALGVSPIKAEHMFKAYTGYLGGYLMWGTDNILWDEEKFGEKPDSKASDNVFLRRFLTADVRPGTSTMNKFFDLKEKSDKIVATFKQTVDVRRGIRKQAGDGKFKDDKFFGLSGEEKAVLFGLNDSMNQLIKALYGKEGIKTAELQVRYDKKLTGSEKRAKLDDLWRSRNKAYMSYYTAADKAMQKAKQKSEQMEKEQ